MVEGGLDPRWIGVAYPKAVWHFHRQLLRRYGIVLAPGEFSQIVRDLRSGQAMLIKPRPKNTAIYSVRIASAQERVYILARSQEILTAWPPQRRLNDIRRRLRVPNKGVAGDLG